MSRASVSDQNPAPAPYRRGETIPALFGWCARRWPEATALVDGPVRLTYAELDDRSDAYAADLIDAGVVPGDFVAVLLDRTADTVAVLLAILKCGAAYAAIDPGWPRERQAWLLDQVRPRLLASHDGSWSWPRWQPSTEPSGGRRPAPVRVRGTDACAVFFTSGSTGVPKGVVLPHHGTARLYDECDFADFGPGMVLPQMFPLHWDGPILDLWGPLLCGGTSVLIDDVMQPELLRTLIARDGVTAACLPTAVFNMIVDEDIEAFEGLRWVLTGSEKVSPVHLARLLRRYPDLRLSNGYGPVESTALVTIHQIDIADTRNPAGVPIGRVMTNSAVYVLDGDRPCRPGETGEICLGGDGLALCYLNAPDLTAQKFVTLTLDGTPTRLYRTGDLGWFDVRGTLHFTGRNDDQVKIRGHRIEPGEIERTAETIPGVARCAVIALPGSGGRTGSLALFYVAGAGPDLDELRAALAATLPAYLVPRDVHRLDWLPLTRNGKVDRRALAARAIARPRRASANPGSGSGSGSGSIDPDGRPDVEAAVEAAFGGLFPDEHPERDDDFFDLGGSSLEAARLCARLATALRVSVPVSQVYRTPTIAGLTAWLHRTRPDRPRSFAGVTPPATGPVRLTTGQVNYVDAPAGMVCLLAWWIRGNPDPAAWSAALDDVHRRHQSLHAAYHRGAPPTATIPADPGSVEQHRLPDAPHREAALDFLGTRLAVPLDITAGRIWRAGTVAYPGGMLFGVGIHHIAFDGSSESVLVADLSTAYAARAAGTVPVWDDPAPSLSDLAVDEDDRLASIDLDAQRRFWVDELRDLRRLALPGVPPGPLPPSGPTEAVLVTVTPDELRPWDAYARERHVGRLCYLVAAFARVLRDVSGATGAAGAPRHDVGMLVPVAARGSAIVDAAVMSRLDAVCLRLRPTPDGVDPLDHARHVVNTALAAQDVPLRDVMTAVAALRPDVHALLNLPIFLFQDHERRRPELAGCAVEVAVDRLSQDQTGPLAVEVLPTADGGAVLRVTVRTDRVPVVLAGRIADAYAAVLRDGPHALVAGTPGIPGCDTSGCDTSGCDTSVLATR